MRDLTAKAERQRQIEREVGLACCVVPATLAVSLASLDMPQTWLNIAEQAEEPLWSSRSSPTWHHPEIARKIWMSMLLNMFRICCAESQVFYQVAKAKWKEVKSISCMSGI